VFEYDYAGKAYAFVVNGQVSVHALCRDHSDSLLHVERHCVWRETVRSGQYAVDGVARSDRCVGCAHVTSLRARVCV
jgi:hypothetical protein